MKQELMILLALFVILPNLFGQNNSARIQDAVSKESIPFVNIKINETESLVSNSEGYFTLPETSYDDNAVVTLSYLGYSERQLTIKEIKDNNLIILLTPSLYELNEVEVSNKKIDPYEIIARVKENLKRNYKMDQQPYKDVLFYRSYESLIPLQLDIEIDKSTGYNDQGLIKANTELNALSSKLKAQPPQQYTDVLCHYYSHLKKKEDKPFFETKLNVIKGTKLKNTNSAVSLDELEELGKSILLKHVDSTKFYRIKSGLFGSRDTISLRKDFNEKKKKIKENATTLLKSSLSEFLYLQPFYQQYIQEDDLYEYTYEGSTFSNENEFVYIIRFKPKKRNAKYKGKLFISETDYAIIRADYALEEGKKVSGFNMKFLLGVKTSENVSNGSIIYKKDSSKNTYYLHYATIEKGNYSYINRPLKFIELTKGEKDIIAFDLKIEVNTLEKNEFLRISRSNTDDSTIENSNETDFKYIHLKAYDPKIWKDYLVIEPLEQMKQLKTE